MIANNFLPVVSFVASRRRAWLRRAACAGALLVATALSTPVRGRAGSTPALPPAPVPTQQSPAPVPTFTRDIAPLVFEHCVRCHRPGASGPFPLLAYDDLRARARQVVTAVVSRRMPPWKPDGPPGEFAGDRRITNDQIERFQRWLDGGAPRGDASDMPPVPPLTGAWELGEPDLVVRLERPYELQGGGRDRLRNFVVPLRVGSTQYVRAWELKTTNPRVVHHVTLMVDRGGGARRFDAQTAESGYEGPIPFTAQSPEGYFLGWTPGQRAQQASSGMAWRIDPGNDLIVMLHMRPVEAPEVVDARVALYFSDRPPTRVPVMIRLNRQDLDIPAGAANHAAEDSYTLPVDVDLHAVQPHAHYLASTVSVTARFPDGASRSLLRIPRWDFHWQDVYRFAEPVPLPAGTRLSMAFSFDNSAANRANPNQPPRRVIWGQRSSDEMADVWLQVVPRHEADHVRLVADLRRKLVPQDIDGYRKMLEVEPDNPALHDDLALLAVESGNGALAIAQFGEVVRLRPGVSASHYNLGNVLLAAGRGGEAIARFREALRLDPGYGLAHQGLGLALAAIGRHDESAVSLESAVRLMPTSADPSYNLGVVRHQQGRDNEALAAYERAARLDTRHADARYGAALIRAARGEHAVSVRLLREALDIRPQWMPAQIELAWLLAVAPDASLRSPDEAARLAASVVGSAGAAADSRAHDVLGAALAAVGRYADAAVEARAALARIDRSANPALRDAIAERIALYERAQPFRLR